MKTTTTKKTAMFAAVVLIASAVILAGPVLPRALGDEPYVPAVITNVTPQPAWSGSWLTITGTGFLQNWTGTGNAIQFGRGWGPTVNYQKNRDSFKKWSDTEIIVEVPRGSLEGTLIVDRSGSWVEYSPFDLVPHIDSLSPSKAAPGDVVSVKGGSLTGLENDPTKSQLDHIKVFLAGKQIPADNFVNPDTNFMYRFDDLRIDFKVPDDAKSGDLYVKNDFGTSNKKRLEVSGVAPPPSTTGTNLYLAEGSAAWGFDTSIEVLQLGGGSDFSVTYMTGNGAVKGQTLKRSNGAKKIVIHANGVKGIAGKDFSTMLHSEKKNDYIGGVHRLMTWNSGRGKGGHLSGAVNGPSKTWYLPEGSTTWGFETYLLVQNPNEKSANVNITYMTTAGPVARAPLPVAANSRTTVNVTGEFPGHDFSTAVSSDLPVIAERAMYWDGRREGSDSTGAPAAAQDFFLAEGSTTHGFDEWVLVQNPNNEPVDLDVTWLTYNGPVSRPRVTVGANSRYTIHANAEIQGDISVAVHGSKPIVAERAMYWNNGTGKAGHTSIGVTTPLRRWDFGTGNTSPGWETWMLVQNPNPRPVLVEAVFVDENGGSKNFTVSVPAQSRYTFDPALFMPGKSLGMYACVNQGNDKIIAEQAIYWDNRAGGGCALGCGL